MSSIRIAFATTLFVALPAAATAQQATVDFELSVQNIMRGPELVGSSPGGIDWTDDSGWIYFRWKPGGLDWDEPSSLYRVPAEGGEPEEVPDEVADSIGPLLASGDLSPDRRRRVVSHDGDLFLIDRASADVRRLTETRENESDPVFSADGRAVFYVRGDNLYSIGLEDGAIRQHTDIRQGSSPRDSPEPEGRDAFLRDQQRKLFEHIRRQAERREESEAEREAESPELPEPIYIDQRERLSDIAVEPGGRYAVLMVAEPAPDGRSTMVPDWITEDGYTVARNVRGKVGDPQRQSRLGVVELESGRAAWLELVPDSGSAAAPVAGPDSDKLASVRFIGWNRDGTTGLIAAVGYAHKDQWLYALDAASGELTLLAHDRDEAWIGGPCSTWTGCAGWMPAGDAAYFLSERDGYSHLYVVGIDGGEPRQLTRGEFEVHDAEISPDEDRFYLTTTEESPFERHFYQMALDGGERTRITGMAGHNDATVSPDGERLAVVHSYANRPPELYVQENRAGAEMRRVTRSPTEEWASFDWLAPEIIHFTARDGVRVPARIYRPADLGAEANGAAVIFVHGAGYLHNVHDGWSSYYREYMFHHLLASRGYVVLDIDYRGSAGYGRDWRTAIYRHMGGRDLTDQVDGARYLVENEGVEGHERIGIYGGSYGGFITLMALFRNPESFGAGAALRSVTDWAHYNHWYTSRILNLPHEDPEAYRQSSPIYFAEGLEDPLLIAHGMFDTNVHFSDVVRLSQRLIELGKTDWEMAVYPVENHGFSEPTSWTDEYRRILKLFDESLHPRVAGTASQP